MNQGFVVEINQGKLRLIREMFLRHKALHLDGRAASEAEDSSRLAGADGASGRFADLLSEIIDSVEMSLSRWLAQKPEI